MRKSLKALFVASALAAGLAAAPTVFAHETQAPQSPTMGHGSMMGQGGMMGRGGMTGQGGMMGMMHMMGQMSQMMETCNKMMQGTMEKPDQAPEAPSRMHE